MKSVQSVKIHPALRARVLILHKWFFTGVYQRNGKPLTLLTTLTTDSTDRGRAVQSSGGAVLHSAAPANFYAHEIQFRPATFFLETKQ